MSMLRNHFGLISLFAVQLGFYQIYNNDLVWKYIYRFDTNRIFEFIWSFKNKHKTNNEVIQLIKESIKSNSYDVKQINSTISDSSMYQSGWQVNLKNIEKISTDLVKNKFTNVSVNNYYVNYPYYNRIILVPHYDSKTLCVEFGD